MKRIGICAAVLALLSLLATASPPAQNPAGKNPPKAQENIPPSLSHRIRHQLQVLPYFSVFDYIAYSLEGSKVTLSGQVVRPTLRAQAVAAVKSIEGVGSVINHIEVLPVSPGDDELRRGVYRAIYEDATLARYAVSDVPSIHIIVRNGSVALEGTVESTSDKNRAALLAGGVAKVLSVKNNVVVGPPGGTAE